MQYQDLAIMPNQHECINEKCAMCGENIYWVIAENREYHYCKRCRTVKLYIE